MSLRSLPVAAPVDSPTQQHSSLLTDTVVLHSGNLSGVSQIPGVSELGSPPGPGPAPVPRPLPGHKHEVALKLILQIQG